MSIFIIGGMDSFKYIGDENLIFSDDENEEDEDDDKKIKEEKIELNTKPMEQIFEIVLNNLEKDAPAPAIIPSLTIAAPTPVPLDKSEKKINKKIRWVKYYI